MTYWILLLIAFLVSAVGGILHGLGRSYAEKCPERAALGSKYQLFGKVLGFIGRISFAVLLVLLPFKYLGCAASFLK